MVEAQEGVGRHDDPTGHRHRVVRRRVQVLAPEVVGPAGRVGREGRLRIVPPIDARAGDLHPVPARGVLQIVAEHVDPGSPLLADPGLGHRGGRRVQVHLDRRDGVPHLGAVERGDAGRCRPGWRTPAGARCRGRRSRSPRSAGWRRPRSRSARPWRARARSTVWPLKVPPSVIRKAALLLTPLLSWTPPSSNSSRSCCVGGLVIRSGEPKSVGSSMSRTRSARARPRRSAIWSPACRCRRRWSGR